MTEIPELDLSDPAVVADPFSAYGAAREACPLARLRTPGFGGMLAVTRYAEAKAMLTDPRFQPSSASYLRPEVPADCQPYLRTMQEVGPAEHARLRRLVAPAFTARRAAAFRQRVVGIVDALLDELVEHADADGTADFLGGVARPLPMDVICALVGIPERDWPAWRGYGLAITTGHGPAFAAAIPAVIRDARAAVASRAEEPGEDLLTELIRVHAEDGDRLSEVELVTLVWHLVLAGQTPANLVANALAELLHRPAELAALRADETLMPAAVEELTRWCGPQLLGVPRFATEDVEFAGLPIGKGEPVTAALAVANRDPRVFTDPERLDLRRGPGQQAHLGYGHGPYFCVGTALARVQTEVLLTGLLRRFPAIALPDGGAVRAPDPGTWRLAELRVRLG